MVAHPLMAGRLMISWKNSAPRSVNNLRMNHS